MHHFAYRRGVSHANVLHAEEVDLCSLADAVGTPFYCYSTATLERHYRVFADAFAARPDTLARAGRIPGITPAAISLLLIHLKRRGLLGSGGEPQTPGPQSPEPDSRRQSA